MNESPVETDGALVIPPADGPAPGMIRLRMDLSYEGTELAGWQRQGTLRTGQVLVEEALRTVLRLPEVPGTICAGRTDAGVHARGQVLHVDVPIHAWQAVDSVAYRMRAVLPPDVAVHSLVEAPPGFDARFSVDRRRYVYRVSDRKGADPLTRRFVLDHGYPLDVDAMNRASKPLLGLHDFAAYCRSNPARTTVRTLLEFNWHRDPSEDHLVVATVSADAFCHSMVRSLVGALLPVGDGRQPESFPNDVLEGRQRTALVTVVSAHGLTFEEVLYVPDDQLGEQAARTKRRRTLQDLQDAKDRQGEATWPASTSNT
jgi:tRNA pseudouridine38-40 synthase